MIWEQAKDKFDVTFHTLHPVSTLPDQTPNKTGGIGMQVSGLGCTHYITYSLCDLLMKLGQVAAMTWSQSYGWIWSQGNAVLMATNIQNSSS